MDPQDDPEARIKALEQPLADTARATELGTTPYTGKGTYLPPQGPPAPPTPPQAPAPNYGAPYTPPGAQYPPPGAPYTPPGSPYTPPGYGAPWTQPPQKTSAGIPWVVLGIGAAVFMAVAAGVGVYMSSKATHNFPIINIPSISVPSFPTSIPSIQPNVPSGGPANTVTPAAPGGQLSVSGISETKTLACNNSEVSISGVSNTVTITGHCATVTVSGMQNKVTLDTSDQIDASGLNNTVTYHSGSPDVSNDGQNVVQQG
jgi:hypothetical protein